MNKMRKLMPDVEIEGEIGVKQHPPPLENIGTTS
jgi:hypothetical protein